MNVDTGKVRRFTDAQLDEMPAAEREKWVGLPDHLVAEASRMSRNQRRQYAKQVRRGRSPEDAFSIAINGSSVSASTASRSLSSLGSSPAAAASGP